jgi:TrmH family RNA methyltransferase
MDVALKRYQREFPYSYAFGVFPTLELLQHQPGHAIKVLVHSKGQANEGVEKLRAMCADAHIALETNDRAIERLSTKESHFAVGVFAKYRIPLDPADDHAVLVRPSDMGNLGTILRTLLGFGVRNLAIAGPAADLFDPRVVRASMGALFQVACADFAGFDDYRQAFPEHAVCAFMTDGRQPLDNAVFPTPCALVFGNESSGLGPEYLGLGASIAIPQSGAIDSLSLPVAVGIALYVYSRSRALR